MIQAGFIELQMSSEKYYTCLSQDEDPFKGDGEERFSFSRKNFQAFFQSKTSLKNAGLKGSTVRKDDLLRVKGVDLFSRLNLSHPEVPGFPCLQSDLILFCDFIFQRN